MHKSLAALPLEIFPFPYTPNVVEIIKGRTRQISEMSRHWKLGVKPRTAVSSRGDCRDIGIYNLFATNVNFSQLRGIRG